TPLPPEAPVTPGAVAAALRDGARLRRSAVADFVYLDRPDAPLLFVGGMDYPLSPALAFAAPLLTGPTPLTHDALAPHLDADGFLPLLAELVDTGHLWIAK
ncbi:MAG: cupin domain-containing protein, partial [Bacteroidetes bacterium]|nr:cupin domain-containing protein [Bacteroidota bacterium]